MTKPLFVLDTSLIISALIFKNSVPDQAFNLVFQSGEVLQSDATVEELKTVTQRKKFNKYVMEEIRFEFLENF